jgi:4-amino-4-deoxy-L-arabinose transferase-like glycosyltransferase
MEFKSRTAIVDCAGWGLLILGMAVIVFRLNGTLTTSPIEADAFQNAALAVALARTGTFSQEITDPSPTMYREPLPPAALALQMAIDPRFSNVATTDELNREPAIVALKQHNLAWAILILCGIPLLIRAFIKPRLVWFICSVAAIVLTSIFYLRRPEILDTFYTEIQASALLVWSAVAACAAVRTQKILYFLGLGVLLGALVLTKAVFFYVMWPYLALLLALLLTGRPRYTLRHGIVCITAALIGAIVIAGPWLARNQINFGVPKVAARGGVVLWIRALSNQMNDEEWLGAFYVYGPPEYAKRLRKLLGYSSAHEAMEGPLRRLNQRSKSSFGKSDRKAERRGEPDRAVSFYRAARADRTKLRREFSAQGYAHTTILADRELQRLALTRITAEPLRHLRTIPVFLWRIMWPVSPEISFLGMLAIWTLTLVSLIKRQPAMFGAFGLAVGMIAFYVAVSHAIPRYSAPAVPLMIAAMSLLTGWGLIAVMSWIDPGLLNRSIRPLESKG